MLPKGCDVHKSYILHLYLKYKNGFIFDLVIK